MAKFIHTDQYGLSWRARFHQQPIETAPKDELVYLLVRKKWVGGTLSGGTWRGENGKVLKPTHWMPASETEPVAKEKRNG